MDCSGIKKIIPGYIKHTASQGDAAAVEEHLCVCNDCRKFVGQLMDEFVDAQAGTEASGGETVAASDVPTGNKETLPVNDPPSARFSNPPSVSAVSGQGGGDGKAAAGVTEVTGRKKKINLGDMAIIGVAVITLLFFISFLMK